MSEHDPDDAGPPHRPQNRQTSASKLRRGGRHCPVCLEPLPKNAGRTRRVRYCPACGAHPSQGKHCLRCGAEAVWESRQRAACRSCALHGSKCEVIAPPGTP